MARVCVLGLGNLLWADEGFGVRAAEQLLPYYAGTEEVEIIDGGTQGMALLPYIQQAQQLLILDAIDFAMPPGSLAVFHDQQVPAYLTAKKLSLHQTGFAEVLAVMQLLGGGPSQIVLVGVQPYCLDDYGGSLSAEVKARLPAAVERVMNILRDWGINPQAQQPCTSAAINHYSLEISRYENQRPDHHSACRIGDERVLARRRG